MNDLVQNLDPDTPVKGAGEICKDMAVSGLKSMATKGSIQYMNYASDEAVIHKGYELIDYSEYFGETVKWFYNTVGDAILYVWE